MRNKKTLLFIIFLAIAFSILSLNVFDIKAQASTLTEAQIQAILNLLRAFNAETTVISNVDSALRGVSTPDTVWCYDFNVNLGIGSSGADVRALQIALEKEGFYQRIITGTFDEYTASAVVSFQEKHASDILAPWVLVRGTGHVGRTTREKLNDLYGCPEEVAEEEIMEVSLSSNLKSIMAQTDSEEFEVFSIEQWQEWAEENWDNFVPEPIIIAGIETQPKDFSYFTKAELISHKNKILFVPEAYRALITFSAVSVLDLKTNEISVINITWGSVGDVVWSPDGNYLVYTLGSARAGGEKLSVDDFTQKRNIFMLDAAKIIQSLELEIESGYHFLPEFRDIEWSSDSQMIYFTTNAKTTQFFEKMGEVRWVINRDGTGLEKIEEIIEGETADWKIYRNEKYGFEFKYPSEIYGYPSGEPLEEIIIHEAECLRGRFSYRFDYLNSFYLSVCDQEEKTLQQWVAEDISKMLLDWPAASYNVDDIIEEILLNAKDITVSGKQGIKVFSLSDFRVCSAYPWCLIVKAYFSDNGRIFSFGLYNGGDFIEEKEELIDQMLSTFKFIDKNVSCEESSKYFVISKRSEDYIKSDFLVKYKTDKDQVISCDYIVAEGDFEIKNQDATYFLALTDNFLLLDRGTAPSPRILSAYDLNACEEVYTDKYSYHPFESFKVLNDTIKYWSPIDEEVTSDNCPEFYELYELWGGIGAEIEAYVILNLTDLTKEELGEYRCSYRQ